MKLRLLIIFFIAASLHAQLSGVSKTPINGGPAFPNSMTLGPDGNTWFTDFKGNTVGRLTPSGTVTTFPLPNANSVVDTITAGMDGNLWFTEEAGRIGRITPSGAITEFPIGNAITPTALIVSGSDGALYFLDQVNGANVKLGRITTAGAITTYDLGSRDTITAVLTGPDGNIWMYDVTKNAMVVFDVTKKAVTATHPVPSPSGTFTNRVVLGLDGNLWFTHANNIARMKADGTLTEYPVPTANAQPSSISVGGDGNIWFAEYQAKKLGQLVLKTAKDNGTATINESDAILNSGSVDLVPVTSRSVAGKIGATDTIPCSEQTFISRFSIDGVWYYVTWTGIVQSPCADVAVSSGVNGKGNLIGGFSNGGPSTATNVVITMYVSNPFTKYDLGDAAKQGTVSVNGNSATLTIPSLPSGALGSITLDVGGEGGDITITGVSDTPDPNVKNNVDYDDSVGGGNFFGPFAPIGEIQHNLAPVPTQRGGH